MRTHTVTFMICCHAVFIFAHGGLVGIFHMEDNVAVLLDDAGESRCTSSLTSLLLGPQRWIEVTHRSSFK